MSIRPETLSSPALAPTRHQVAQALAAVSAERNAPALLGVSANLMDEIARNLKLRSAPTLPARELYTGVLYDALDLASMDTATKRRANSRLAVISALYGVLRMNDRVAPYRLSMAVSLPGIGPLASFWRPHLGPVLTGMAGHGLIIDARSSTYAAAWLPRGELTRRWVTVKIPGATHMAKHTRGLVARALCHAPANPRKPEALVELLEDDFDVRLTKPARDGNPWVLEATAR